MNSKFVAGVCALLIVSLIWYSAELNSQRSALEQENATLVNANAQLTDDLNLERSKNAKLFKDLEYSNSQTGYNIIRETCFTSINGQTIRLNFDIDELPDAETFRDILFGGKGEINCPAYVSLRHFTQDLSDTERDVFCLTYDKERITYTGISLGERDAYLVCDDSKTFCEHVKVAKDEALAVAALGGAAATASAGATAAANAAGVTVVAHSSGAVILTGTSGYIAGTLGTIGASTLAVLTSPVVITAGVITVVGVGGSVYLCK